MLFLLLLLKIIINLLSIQLNACQNQNEELSRNLYSIQKKYEEDKEIDNNNIEKKSKNQSRSLSKNPSQMIQNKNQNISKKKF